MSTTTNVTSTPAPIVWPTDPKLYDSTHYVLAAGYCVLALVTATIVVKKLFSGTLKVSRKEGGGVSED